MPRDLGVNVAAPAGGRDLGVNVAGEPPGKMSAFARGAGQGATLGFEDELAGGLGALQDLGDRRGNEGLGDMLVRRYREARDSERQANAAAEAAHPNYYTAGSVAGGLATAPILPGGAVKTLGGAIAAGAALGAASGLGSSNADLTKGEVGGAAADTAAGGVLGAGAGAAGYKLASMIPGAAHGAADELRDLSERKAVNATRPTAQEVRKLIEAGKLNEVGKFLLDHQIVEAGDTFQSIAPKAEGVRAGAGKALEDIIAELDKRGATVSKVGLAQSFLDAAMDAEQKGPAAKPVVDKFLSIAQDIGNHPGPDRIPLSQAEMWKRGFQDVVNYAKSNNTPLQEGSREAAEIARQAVEDAAQKASAGTPLADQFMLAKTAYGNAAKASSMTEGALARQEARNIASPSDKYAGGAALAAGLMTGHPVAGVVGGVAAGVANKVIRDRAASTTAVAARSLAEKVQQLAVASPKKLGSYGALLAGALERGGQDEFNAHMYTLGQTDPKFQELTKKLADEEAP